jgi:hypothetical protein
MYQDLKLHRHQKDNIKSTHTSIEQLQQQHQAGKSFSAFKDLCTNKKGLPFETQRALLQNVWTFQGHNDFARGDKMH